MFSIGAIFKNEYPYIIEWIAYHMVLGINDIYVADNISTDGSSELLYYLDKIGMIKRIEHPTQGNIPPQLAAYTKILSMLEHDKWIAFIDADEFITPSNYEDGLKNLFPLLTDQSNGAISLNWAVYGSSNSILPDDGLVIERFIKRAADLHPVNRHYKSIVRVGDVIGTGPTPHAFRIKKNKNFIMPNGVIHNSINGLSETIDWATIRLNHYVIKSKSEFLNKKASRGLATFVNKDVNRNMFFFRSHDLNHTEQSIPPYFLKRVHHQINRINGALIDSGYQAISPEPCTPFYKTSKNMGVGFVDSFNRDKNVLTLRGWAVDSDKEPCDDIAIVINNTMLLRPNTTSFYERPDVQGAGQSNDVECGFISLVELPDVAIYDFFIYATNSAGLACAELKISEKLTDTLVLRM